MKQGSSYLVKNGTLEVGAGEGGGPAQRLALSQGQDSCEAGEVGQDFMCAAAAGLLR